MSNAGISFHYKTNHQEERKRDLLNASQKKEQNRMIKESPMKSPTKVAAKKSKSVIKLEKIEIKEESKSPLRKNSLKIPARNKAVTSQRSLKSGNNKGTAKKSDKI